MVVLFFATPLFAQFDFPPTSAVSTALGGCSVALTDEQAAVSIGAAAWSEDVVVELSALQPYYTKDLGIGSLNVVVPLGHGGLLAEFLHSGSSDYFEQRASLGYSLRLDKSLSLGAEFHYLHSGTSDGYYDPLRRVTFTLAMQYRHSETLSVGFKAYNPIAVFADDDFSPNVPAIFNMGASYRFVPSMLAFVEVEKNLYHSASLHVGVEYVIDDSYYLRAGMSTQPVAYAFGVGCTGSHFGCDIAVAYNTLLGITPSLSVHYLF